MTVPDIFAFDVGVPSRRKGPAGHNARSSSVGWAGPTTTGDTIAGLATSLAGALGQGKGPVHLYVEAPLFLPADPARCGEAELCARRPFEYAGGSPQAWMTAGTVWPEQGWGWTGNAGGAALAMGVQELTWLLAQLRAAAINAGATLEVDTCPQAGPGAAEKGDCGCAPSSGAAGVWRLTILEAFHPREAYPRTAGAHGFPLLGKNVTHVQVAQRVRDVAGHFGSVPRLGPRCVCPAPPVGRQSGVWYDSTTFWPGAGTFNLVALACWAASIGSGPARGDHGWVLCA